MMCDEKQHIEVTYRVMRRRGKRLRRTSWTRTTFACRTAWSRWQVYHNSRWFTLHRSEQGEWYIEVK